MKLVPPRVHEPQKARGGIEMQASHFLAAMQKQRAPYDVISYNSTISACERGGEWQLASSLFRGIWGNGWGTKI